MQLAQKPAAHHRRAAARTVPTPAPSKAAQLRFARIEKFVKALPLKKTKVSADLDWDQTGLPV